jgi:hypothetical protein
VRPGSKNFMKETEFLAQREWAEGKADCPRTNIQLCIVHDVLETRARRPRRQIAAFARGKHPR